jgi:hypothetical protein
VPWQQILQYRNDSESQSRFYDLKEWMSDLACGALGPAEAEQKRESLLDRYRALRQTYAIQINWTKLEAFVVSTPEVVAGFQQGQRDFRLFSVKDRKVSLLDGESTSPGRVVAFVLPAQSMLSFAQSPTTSTTS